MPRKFSIDIPRLMVSRKPTKEQDDSYPESPPPPARSVRPALPEDVEAALRSICTKIFNETNATQLPDTDHDLLRAFWQSADEEQAVQQKVQHVHMSQHIVQQVASHPLPKRKDSSKHRNEGPVRVDAPRAKTHLTASLPKTVQRSRPAAAARGDSIDTVNSVSQSDLTDPSTAMTSAFITPYSGSKRGSSQATWTHEDENKRAYTNKRDSAQELSSPDLAQTQTEAIEQPPASRGRGFFHGLIHGHDERPSTGSTGLRGRTGTMESTADERTGRTSFRSRAASSARSLSRGVKEYLRPSSRREPGDTVTIDQHAAAIAMESSRPNTSSGMRKASMEFFRRGRRASRGSRDDREDTKTSPHGFRQLNVVVANYKPAPVEAKRIDLNRALPPLPALDLWQDAPAVAGAEHDDAEEPLELPRTPVSPFPVMSATAFPGDFDNFDMFAPAQSRSSISESSFRDLQRSREGSIALSCLSDAELESPRFAMLVGNRSVPDLKPHLVINRRPSTASRPEDLQLEDDEVPALPNTIETIRREELAGRASMDDSIGTRPVVMLRKKTRKSWWKGGKFKKHDWMSDVEHSGSKSGMLVVGDTAASPVVKYSS